LNLWSGSEDRSVCPWPVLTFPAVNYSSSIALVEECLVHAKNPQDKARLLWIRSRVQWAKNQFGLALKDSLQALQFLGMTIDPNPTLQAVDASFEDLQSKLFSMGIDNIQDLPVCTDERVNLISSLLMESCNNAYWMDSNQLLCESLGIQVTNYCCQTPPAH
jgi:predicted ATPase